MKRTRRPDGRGGRGGRGEGGGGEGPRRRKMAKAEEGGVPLMRATIQCVEHRQRGMQPATGFQHS